MRRRQRQRRKLSVGPDLRCVPGSEFRHADGAHLLMRCQRVMEILMSQNHITRSVNATNVDKSAGHVYFQGYT